MNEKYLPAIIWIAFTIISLFFWTDVSAREAYNPNGWDRLLIIGYVLINMGIGFIAGKDWK